jgi:putative transposase
MPDYRRNYVPGGTWFFTVVTFERSPLFAQEDSRALLRGAIQTVRARFPLSIVAIVLLPDHLHCIWTLPEGESNHSTHWRRIKEQFTRTYLDAGGAEGNRRESRLRHGERAVWQRRFWEHTCRDQDDLNRCIDYIHWNPVKHGLVERVRDYPWSSFHRYVEHGVYPLDWGSVDPCPGYVSPEWNDEGFGNPETPSMGTVVVDP